MSDSEALFAAVIEEYKALGFPHEVIGQWTLPSNDVRDLVEAIRRYQPQNVLEVGTFVGLSTMLIALSSNQNTRVTSVDPNFPLEVEMGSMGSRIGDSDGRKSTHEIARAVARRLNVDNRINLVAGGFASGATFASRRTNSGLSIPIVGPELCAANGPFDLAFIDGLHFAEAVEADLDLVSRHLTPGGIVLMHDCIGMWGTNVRCGILRFLARHPEWQFLHCPFQSLYRSIGLVFRRAEHPDLSREFLTQPKLVPSIAGLLKPLVTSLTQRLHPSHVIEIASGEGLLATHFEGPTRTEVVQVAEDLCGRIEARIQSALAKGSQPKNLFVASVGALDIVEDESFSKLLDIISQHKVIGLFFRTPPGERGAACQYSRPLRSWVEKAEEVAAEIRIARTFDLDPSRFLFVKSEAQREISTSLCSVVLVTSKWADDSDEGLCDFPALSIYQAEAYEQQDLLHIHYDAAFQTIFSEIDSAAKTNQRLNEQLEIQQAAVAPQSVLLKWQRRVLEWPWWRTLFRFSQTFAPKSLNSKQESAIEDALVHAMRSDNPKPCLMLNWMPSVDELNRLLDDPRVGVVGVKDSCEGSLAPDHAADPRIGRYVANGHWALPKGVQSIYFVGPLWLLKRGLLRDAWLSGIRIVYARAGFYWFRIPMGLLYRLHLRKRRAQELLVTVRLKFGNFLQRVGVMRFFPAQIKDRFMTLDESFRLAIKEARVGDTYQLGRIVLVCGNLSPGGAELQVANTLVGLKRRGFADVHLLAHNLQPNRDEMDFHLAKVRSAGVLAREIERVTTSLSDATIPEGLRRAGAVLPANLVFDIADLVREFNRLKPEIVHAWLDWDNIRAGCAAAISGVPRIFLSGRNLAPYNFRLYQSYMGPGYCALATLPNVEFLNNSHAGADDYANWIGIPRERIKVIYNGLGFEAAGRLSAEERSRQRRAMGIDDETFLVGGVFRFEDEKRPLLWLETAARIAKAEPSVRFVLYGQGSMRESMEARIKDLRLDGNVTLAGITSNATEAISLMDVFLLTSYGEGLPNVLLESQAVGTPVVSTRAGGAPEAIEPGVTGIIVDSAEAGELAHAVIDLLRDDEARVNAAIAGPPFVRKKFNSECMIERTIAAYGLMKDRSTERFEKEPS